MGFWTREEMISFCLVVCRKPWTHVVANLHPPPPPVMLRRRPLCYFPKTQLSHMFPILHRCYQMQAKSLQNVLQKFCSWDLPRGIELHRMGYMLLATCWVWAFDTGHCPFSKLFCQKVVQKFSKRLGQGRNQMFWPLSDKMLAKTHASKTFWAGCFLG